MKNIMRLPNADVEYSVGGWLCYNLLLKGADDDRPLMGAL